MVRLLIPCVTLCIYIFAYNLANVGIKPEFKGWNIFVHLYNKKVLKYGEQDVIFVNLVWVIVEIDGVIYKQTCYTRNIYKYMFKDKICIAMLMRG